MMIDSDSFGILPIPKVATFRTFFKSQNVIANNRLCITCKIGHKKSYRNEMSCNFARILLFGARQQQTESPHYGLKILKKCKFFSKDFLIGLFKNSFWTICEVHHWFYPYKHYFLQYFLSTMLWGSRILLYLSWITAWCCYALPALFTKFSFFFPLPQAKISRACIKQYWLFGKIFL